MTEQKNWGERKAGCTLHLGGSITLGGFGAGIKEKDGLKEEGWG